MRDFRAAVLHPCLASWVAAIQSKWGAKRGEAIRIPWSKVRDIGIDVEVDVDADVTPVTDYEQWVREHITKRIPGGE